MVTETHRKLIDNFYKLKAENKSLVIDIGTYVELTSSLATENEQLRKALETIRDSAYNGRSAVIMATDALLQSPDVQGREK